MSTKTNICIVVCVGLPAAGKTTFCETVQNHFCDSYNIVTVSYDMLSDGNYSASTRRGIFNRVKTLLTHALVNVEPDKPTLVIIDDNMYYKSMRHEYCKLARAHKVSFLQVYFEVDVQTALQRNAKRRDKVLDRFIVEMAGKIEAPKSNCCCIGANKMFDHAILNKFRDHVTVALENPISVPDEKTDVLTFRGTSKMHAIDLVLRRIVSRKIRETTGLAGKYLATRKELLEKVKRHEIVVPEASDCECLSQYFENLFL